MGKSKNIPVRTNDIRADYTEEPWASSLTETCGRRETVGLSGEVGAGKSAVAINMTKISTENREWKKTNLPLPTSQSTYRKIANITIL